MSNEHPAAFARESACEVAADASADLDAARLLAELPAPAQPGDERAAARSALLLAAAAVVGAERSGGLWLAVAAEACHAAGQANRAFALSLGLVGDRDSEASADWSTDAATEACEIEEALWTLHGRLARLGAVARVAS